MQEERRKEREKRRGCVKDRKRKRRKEEQKEIGEGKQSGSGEEWDCKKEKGDSCCGLFLLRLVSAFPPSRARQSKTQKERERDAIAIHPWFGCESVCGTQWMERRGCDGKH